MDEVVDPIADAQGRIVRGDPEPEKGYFYRSDHFSLAKEGVPALDPESGIDYVERPQGWGLEMRAKYVREDYHKPSDRIRDDWDLAGAVEDCDLFFQVGLEIARTSHIPEWKPGSEFKAKREASLRKAAHR
jgi:Zn-dependent M28 family amino/carboxypeptidase